MAFRRKEKMLMLAVMGLFCLVCFGTVLYLPERSNYGDVNSNRVYKVYKELQVAGRDLMLPRPPAKGDEAGPSAPMDPNSRHGENVDRHMVEDKRKLQVQAELDRDINELHKKQLQQQVLPKPAIKREEATVPSRKAAKKPNEVARGDPLIMGGADDAALERRNKVAEMMRHAWTNYAKHAWGHNELKPISESGHSASIFGSARMGATIVDAMDTLYIMGMREEFERGREWIRQNLDFAKMVGDISVFETNIRYVGGMLSLYSFTGDELFREKAVHIADKLMPAFKTPTGIPYALVNMRTGAAKNFPWAPSGTSILSEFGTLHMEFAYLSDISGNPVYFDAVEKVRKAVNGSKRQGSLYPNYLHPKTGRWGQEHTSVGALGDSFYEYLLKEWLRSGKTDALAKSMFDSAALGIEKTLVLKSESGLTYIAEYKYGKPFHKMDHLACFAGGMYGLAAHEENDENSERWMEIAKGITNTCHESYDRSATKLGPEAFRFSGGTEARSMKSNEKYYILRPETVESYFVMWRLTHDQKYRDWGWEAVQALEKHCRVEGGFSGVRNVYDTSPLKDDVQQSFFLAETLKYLYLLFSDDDLISLDKWVFNTEAHPLPVKGKNSFYRQAAAAAPASKGADARSR